MGILFLLADEIAQYRVDRVNIGSRTGHQTVSEYSILIDIGVNRLYREIEQSLDVLSNLIALNGIEVARLQLFVQGIPGLDG
jgi:hypothetical protein